MNNEYSKDSIMAREIRKDQLARAEESRLVHLATGGNHKSAFFANFVKAYHWVAHALRHAQRHTPAPVSHREALIHFQPFMHRNNIKSHGGLQGAK